MRSVLLCSSLIFGVCTTVNASDLIEVYREAVVSDPIFQQAIAQRLADKEAVPISVSNLLPNIGVTATPSIYKSTSSGPGSNMLGSYSQRGYQLNATITQTIFNFAQFANVSLSKATSKQADAILNAATQSLILRVSNAYFAVLQDEDNLRYAAANKEVYAKSLDQVTQQYKVGLKTITDVYTAQAAYDSSSASYIATETQLADDKENLRAITGHTYPHLSTLSEQFPLTSPNPAIMEEWVKIATQQNWSVKAAEYANVAALQNVKQQFAGHLPTLNAEGIYNISYTANTGSSNPFFFPPGSDQAHNRTVELNLAVPVFSGGQVVSKTSQARYAYQVASQKLEQTVRGTINTTRQSYLGVIAGISKIHADKLAVKSTQSSYEGLDAQYRVGTATLVDVLNQQEKVLSAQQQYAADRYAYINSLLTLKQAAGTLSPADLQAINCWLNAGEAEYPVSKTKRIPKHLSLLSHHKK